MHHAVHDDLRRIDRAIAARLRITALANAMPAQRKRVLPAEVIPIIYRQAERDQRPVMRQFADQLVRCGTRRTSLAREKFDDRARLARSLRPCERRERDHCQNIYDGTSLHILVLQSPPDGLLGAPLLNRYSLNGEPASCVSAHKRKALTVNDLHDLKVPACAGTFV